LKGKGIPDVINIEKEEEGDRNEKRRVFRYIYLFVNCKAFIAYCEQQNVIENLIQNIYIIKQA
jgi:hypothetical protein